MKKQLLALCLMLIGIAFLGAQDIGGEVRKAVDELAAPLNTRFEVSVGDIFYVGTRTPSGLSRSLAIWIATHANKTGKFIIRTQGAPRPGSGQNGIIQGKFWQEGNTVHVNLQLVNDSGEELKSHLFTLSAQELKEQGIDIFPPNEAVSLLDKNSIAVNVTGAGDGTIRIRDAFATALFGEGFDTQGVNAPYTLDVTVSMSKVVSNNNPYTFCSYTVSANLIENATGKVLLPFPIPPGSVGHPRTYEGAEAVAITAIIGKVNQEYPAVLRKYLASLLPLR
jgi:hypothetical protein